MLLFVEVEIEIDFFIARGSLTAYTAVLPILSIALGVLS